MKALIQRVSWARVEVGTRLVGEIDRGLVVLLGLDAEDDQALGERMLDKLLAYRVFADSEGRMNASVTDIAGGVLLVSQFTLSADTRKGLRPGFSGAMAPAPAKALYDAMLRSLQQRHANVAAGEFGADMQVSLCNDGPVTFMLELP